MDEVFSSKCVYKNFFTSTYLYKFCSGLNKNVKLKLTVQISHGQ